MRDANKVIAFTGAGISTACGIPDFRGPQGVWTCQVGLCRHTLLSYNPVALQTWCLFSLHILCVQAVNSCVSRRQRANILCLLQPQRKGLPPPRLQTSFLYAKPSLTHQALLGLMQSGKLDYICSQNVDSLHLRSGVPRSQLAELHGNCFAERCKKCKQEYIRDFEMDTVSVWKQLVKVLPAYLDADRGPPAILGNSLQSWLCLIDQHTVCRAMQKGCKLKSHFLVSQTRCAYELDVIQLSVIGVYRSTGWFQAHWSPLHSAQLPRSVDRSYLRLGGCST